LYWEINGSYLLAGRPFPQRRAWRGLLLRQQFLSSCCRLTTLKKDNVKDNDRERRRRRWESKRELGSTYSPVLQRGKLLTYQTKHYPSSNPGVSRPRICSKRCTAGQNDLQAAETDNRLVRLRRWDVKSVDLRVKSHSRVGKSSGLKYSSLHCPLQSPPGPTYGVDQQLVISCVYHTIRGAPKVEKRKKNPLRLAFKFSVTLFSMITNVNNCVQNRDLYLLPTFKFLITLFSMITNVNNCVQNRDLYLLPGKVPRYINPPPLSLVFSSTLGNCQHMRCTPCLLFPFFIPTPLCNSHYSGHSAIIHSYLTSSL